MKRIIHYSFDKNKRQVPHCHFFEDDKERIHGMWKWYYENGIIGHSCVYKHGRANGFYCNYLKNGKLYKFLTYKNGTMFGETFNYSAQEIEKIRL